MTEDAEIETLARAWRGITDHVELSVAKALRRRRLQALTLLAEIALGAIVLAAAVHFWRVDDGIVYRVSALVLVATVVAHGFVARRMRSPLLNWADWTPEGVIAFRMRDCEAALVSARYATVGSVILLVFAAFVWLAVELGWDTLPPRFHVLYASVVACAVVVTTGWALWRRATKRAELERLRAILAELRDA